MTKIKLILFFILACGLASCAGVTIYDDSTLTSKTGVRYYTSKPYILLTRTGKKDDPLQISVIYLPDTTKPQYATFKSGFGSAELSIKISNGSLSEFGGKGDSKGPETITALAGGFKTILDALKAKEKAEDKVDEELEEQGLSVEDLKNAAKDLITVADGIEENLALLKALSHSPVTDPYNKNAQQIISKLRGIAGLLIDPNVNIEQLMPQVLIDLKDLGKPINKLRFEIETDSLATLATTNVLQAQWQIMVGSVQKRLGPKKPSKPEFELWEINLDNSNDLVTLKRVEHT